MTRKTLRYAAWLTLCTGTIAGLTTTASAQVAAGVDEDAEYVRTYNLNTGVWLDNFTPADLFAGGTPSGALSSDGPSALAWDAANGIMYWLDSSNLYSWDANTNVQSFLGDVQFTPSGGSATNHLGLAGLAFHNGVLYAVDNTQSTTTGVEGFYTIDLGVTPPASTLILDLTASSGDYTFEGFDYNPLDGLFYVTNDDTTPASGLYSVDLLGTMAITLVTPYAGTATGENGDVDGLAIGVQDGEARAYFIHDENGEYAVYNLTTASFEASIPSMALAATELSAGGAWAPELIPPVADGDLSVVLSTAVSSAVVNDVVTYTVSATNNGSIDLNNVQIVTALDPLTTYVSSTSGMPSGGNHVADFLTLPGLTNVTYDISVSVDAAGTLTATSTGSADEPDPDALNNESSASFLAEVIPPNDDCFSATLVSSFPFSDVQNTSLATADGPAANVTGCNTSTTTTIQNSIWYVVNVPVDQVITVTFTDLTAYDMVAGVWEGSCSLAVDPPIVCDDEPEPIVLQFVALAGMDYLVGIGDWSTTPGGGRTDILMTSEPLVDGACCLNDGRCVDGINALECGELFGSFSAGLTCMDVSCTVVSANDYCDNPEAISEGVSTAGTTVGATGIDVATCGGDELDVWYEFTPAANMGYIVDVTGNATNISVAVYEGCGTENISCDTGTTTAPPSAEFAADCAGTPVLIRVATDSADTSAFSVLVSPLSVPANDRCCAAEPIALGQVLFSDAGAAAAHDDGIASCGFDERDVWYVFTPAQANRLYQARTSNATTNLGMTIYTGCPESGGMEIVCEDPTGNDANAFFTSDAMASPVFIRVAADASATLAPFDIQIFQDDDGCVDATAITALPFSETVLDMETNFPDPDISCNSSSATVLNNGIWWTFEGNGNDHRLTMRDTGITFDEVFTVYEVPTGTDCTTITSLDEMTGGCSDLPEFIFDFNAAVGFTYYFLAGNWSSTALTDTGNEVFISLEEAASADIAVDLTTSTTVASGVGPAGDPIKYLLRLTNDGPSSVSDVVWSVTLPPEVVFSSSTEGTHDGSPTGGVVSGITPFIDLSTTTQIVIVTESTALGEISAASASSAGGEPVDDNLANNSATSRTAVVVEDSTFYGQLILSDDFIDLNYGPEPKSIAPDIDGIRLISGFDKPFISPDGMKWIINADLEDDGTTPPYTASTDETLIVFNGSSTNTVVQEGVSLLPDLSDLVGLIDQKLGINDSAEYVFQADTDAPTASDEVVIKGFGTSYTVIAREGNAFPNGGGFLYGSTLESPNITNSGAVIFWGDTSISSTTTDEFFIGTSDNGVSVNTVLQEGVFIPGNQIGGGTEVLGDIDANDLWVTGTGTHHLYIGDLDGTNTTNDDIAVYDNNVVIQENVLVHPDIGDTADSTTAVDAIFLAHNGDWYARGSNNNDTHWVVKNGAPIAISGQPIYPGATENWRNTATSTFFFVVGDHKGNYVVGGFTDSPDTRRDVVLVLNGERIISREFDPIDLDGNGFFDDSPFHTGGPVFINTYGNDDGIITDDGRLLVTCQTSTIRTDNTGDVFIAIDLGLADACVCELDGNDAQVNVFDLLAYLDLWFANDPGADIDGTPGVNVFDLLAFLDCWFPASAGSPCP